MKTTTFRLSSGMDLKGSILNFIKENNLKAATITSCIGSLSSANIRLAGTSITHGNFYLNLTENFEITSLSGTGESKINCNNNMQDNEVISYGHFHINIAFDNGKKNYIVLIE
jgi:predicted DNA-binding protein with PD1-like motif